MRRRRRPSPPGCARSSLRCTRAGASPCCATARFEATEQFAGSVGFRFFWSRIDKTFLHPNVLVLLTPEGRVARYVYGTRIDPRTLELALIDADWGRISNSADAVFDMITGACFSYNFSEGRYQPNYALFAGLGSLVLGLSLIGAGLFGYRRKLARRRSAHAAV